MSERIQMLAPPVSWEMLFRWADDVRGRLGLRDRLYFPIVEVFERFLPPGWDYDIVEQRNMNEHGLTLPVKKIVMIREDVYDGAVAGVGRDRLTMTHEFFHTHNHGDLTGMARADPKVIYKPYIDPEWQANAGAGALLMPRDAILHMDITDIVRECGVSYDAAKTQKNAVLRQEGKRRVYK